jgi:hypothetical protein
VEGPFSASEWHAMTRSRAASLANIEEGQERKEKKRKEKPLTTQVRYQPQSYSNCFETHSVTTT